MKKTFLGLFLAGCSCVAFAQNDTTQSMKENNMGTDNTTRNTMTTTSEYNAYSSYTATPPDYVHSYIIRDYPAATDLHWRMENSDWWHAYYLDNNNMPMNVYYNTGGNSYIVSLPVKQTWVPDAVVTKTVQLYGPVLYDINTIKGSNKEDVYAVRIIENGVASTVYMDENGNRVMDIYRVETTTDNAAMGTEQPVNTEMKTEVKTETDMNNAEKTKVKTKSADGTINKTKTKNGTTKTKTSGTF